MKDDVGAARRYFGSRTMQRSRLLIKVKSLTNRLHVFVCDVDGQTKYVLPIYGAGLWGPVWGYIALDQ